ncbi:dihydroneopterin aldolase family protein [Halomicrobium urmianum]|uniref:dihydroneopterin aldolase family protein n=1 Tax=Halomicrobium urmianum TaxID=1586233 RepID=UPI001CD935EB|nr:dihydroneopterin aldolase family protein [Halomicrobium urmianum]
MDPTDSEVACFEAGIKFGSLYHQFAGTPIGLDSADSLATAMAEAIENQPHCEAVTVEIREEALREAIDAADADYVEFTGRFAEVEMRIDYEGVTVETSMRMDGEYPLMAVEDVRAAD